MQTDIESIRKQLKALAPSCVFSFIREIDHSFRWDGCGPDPREEGFDPYDVEIRAETIIDGESVRASSYLGGCYFKPREFDKDVSGYAPQMLEEAASELFDMVSAKCPETAEQLRAVCAYLADVMRARYNEQMAAR